MEARRFGVKRVVSLWPPLWTKRFEQKGKNLLRLQDKNQLEKELYRLALLTAGVIHIDHVTQSKREKLRMKTRSEESAFRSDSYAGREYAQ